MTPDTTNSSHNRALLLAALGVLGFSFTLPMTKIIVRGADPIFAAAGRAVGASVLATITLIVTQRSFPSRPQCARLLVIAGGVVVGFPLLTAYAVRLVPASHGAVVTGLLPLTTAGIAVVRAGERPSRRYWACSVTGFGAVVTFALHEGGGSLHVADLLLVGAIVVAAIGYVEGVLLTRVMRGWEIISWALVLSAPAMVALTVLSLIQHGAPQFTAGQALAFGYTAAISAFAAFFAWYAGLSGAGIARAGQLQLMQPVLSIIWCWPLLSERISGATLLTAAVVIGAVALGRRSVVAAAEPIPA